MSPSPGPPTGDTCRSPDRASAAGTRVALWMLTLADKTTAPFGDVSSTGSIGSVFSPDGKWLAYAKGTGGAV